MGQDKEGERSFSNSCHGQNGLDLGKINLVLTIKSEKDNAKENLNLKAPSSHSRLLSRLNFTPVFSTSYLSAAQGKREQGLQALYHTFLPLLPHQGEDSSHSSLAPVWSPCHRRQYSMNFSNVSAFHRLQFSTNFSAWNLSTGCILSGTDCCSMGPLQSHKSFQQTCSNKDSLSPQVIGHARAILQEGLLTGSQPPSSTPSCSDVGSSMGCRWISASLWTSMGCK